MPLKQAIDEACHELNIDCTEYFAKKLFEFYEMLRIRSGIMIIGDSFAGKTTIYRVLANAFNKLNEKNQMNELRATCTVINPMSVTIGQLYGEFDGVSHEWRDGILAINVRRFANANVVDDTNDGGGNDDDRQRKWLVFDGPIDAIWMNSVLDDNRKLCLMSGDTIQLTDTMHLIFEPLNLETASPSIVCVFVYGSINNYLYGFFLIRCLDVV